MTLPREPLTVEDGLDKVIGGLQMSGAIAVTGRSRSYLEKLRHPARREQLTVLDMIKLDDAHMRKHGTAPIFETIATIYQSLHAEMFSDAAELSSIALLAIKENSEAEVAMIEAAQPQADQAAWDRAEREVAEAVPILNRALAFIRQRKEDRRARPP